MKRLLGLVLVFLLSGCVAGNLATETEVRQYSGDGTIYNCSILFSPGYRIEFPKFNSARPYEASYRLSHVPPTARWPAVIYLRFFQQDFITAREKKNSVTASFRIALCDTKGHILHSAEFQLSNATWTESQRLFGVYDLGKSYLHFERAASYVLNVSYTPGAVPPPAEQLYFSVENGCTK
jgi:hypothetical protein